MATMQICQNGELTLGPEQRSRKSLCLNRQLQRLAIIATCLSLLTACVGISGAELNSIGSKLTPVDINFAELKTYAERSRAAYDAKPAIKAKYPKAIRIS